jgi:hypothetical protein
MLPVLVQSCQALPRRISSMLHRRTCSPTLAQPARHVDFADSYRPGDGRPSTSLAARPPRPGGTGPPGSCPSTVRVDKVSCSAICRLVSPYARSGKGGSKGSSAQRTRQSEDALRPSLVEGRRTRSDGRGSAPQASISTSTARAGPERERVHLVTEGPPTAVSPAGSASVSHDRHSPVGARERDVQAVAR